MRSHDDPIYKYDACDGRCGICTRAAQLFIREKAERHLAAAMQVRLQHQARPVNQRQVRTAGAASCRPSVTNTDVDVPSVLFSFAA